MACQSVAGGNRWQIHLQRAWHFQQKKQYVFACPNFSPRYPGRWLGCLMTRMTWLVLPKSTCCFLLWPCHCFAQSPTLLQHSGRCLQIRGQQQTWMAPPESSTHRDSCSTWRFIPAALISACKHLFPSAGAEHSTSQGCFAEWKNSKIRSRDPKLSWLLQHVFTFNVISQAQPWFPALYFPTQGRSCSTFPQREFGGCTRVTFTGEEGQGKGRDPSHLM